MAKIDLAGLRTMAQAAAGDITHVYIHWSAGHYGQQFTDYHILVDKDGTIYTTVSDLTTHLNHTYMRNSRAIAVAALCAYNASSTNDLGPEPPTEAQIEVIAQVLAVLGKKLALPIDIKHFMTHAEAANNLDGEDPGYEDNGCTNGIYGPSPNPDGSPGGDTERWDFWVLHEGDAKWSGGDMLREKALWYQQNS
ncbi:MAG: hypothetical protein H6Q74_2189 [Firmicutes bacterium]|nr:hypothetical protein [Bacillota bacterium]